MEYMLMPYDRYFDFSGRSSRMEYWMFSLFGTIVVIVGITLFMMLGYDAATEDANFFGWFVGVLGIMWILFSIIPSISVTVRRLHDAGFSGWFYFISLVPYVGSLILLIMMVLGSTAGDNKYGPEPN
jgi:uncharacterized membrane protein YhaH (DUF805 family)